MARSFGRDVQCLIKDESSYGVDPTGNYNQVPIISTNFGAEQPHIPSDLLGQGRDPAAPIYDLQRSNGEIVVPLDLRNIGYWLKGLCGAPVTTGAGPYTHTFKSGNNISNSLAIEIGEAKVPAYFLNLGCKVGMMSITMDHQGLPKASFQLVGQSEAKNTTSQGGTPATLTYTRFKGFHGKLQRSGSDLANVLSGSISYDNKLAEVNTLRTGDALIEAYDPDVAECKGNISTRWSATTLWDDAAAGTGLALKYIYSIDSSNQLTITVYEAYLPKPKLNVSGPGGIVRDFSWTAAKNTSQTYMVDFVLVNDKTSY